MRRTVAAIVLALAPLATASAGWWDDLDKGEPVRLSDLTAQPERWKGKVVTFACLYHGFDSVYQPYFTSFNAEKWLNVTAWFDGAPIWEMEAFRDQDFPFLYLERTHPQRDEMLRLEAYTRIEVTGRVKDVYRQRPFLEILGFHVTPATFGKKVADWMRNGDVQASLGDYAKAEANYRLVLAQVTLDETTRLRAQKRLEEALRAAGRPNASDAKAGPVVGGSTMPTPRSRRDAVPAAPEGGVNDPLTPAGQLPGDDPFAKGGETPVTRAPSTGPAPAGTGPTEVTTDDLPGTPVDGHPGTAAPGLGVPDAPPAARRTRPAARPVPPAEPAPACPKPAPDAPAPACPAGSATPDAAPPSPPAGAPPPRSPRLSGVR